MTKQHTYHDHDNHEQPVAGIVQVLAAEQSLNHVLHANQTSYRKGTKAVLVAPVVNDVIDDPSKRYVFSSPEDAAMALRLARWLVVGETTRPCNPYGLTDES